MHLTGASGLSPGDNRENGANPLRGRRCNRPGFRTSCHWCKRIREGVREAVTSREPEDLPVDSLFDAWPSLRTGPRRAFLCPGLLLDRPKHSSCPARQKGLWIMFTFNSLLHPNPPSVPLMREQTQ